jgi:hypothetical protein
MLGKTIAKSLIWSEIRQTAAIIVIADLYGLRDHPFRAALLKLKEKLEADLIKNEERED